MTSSKKAEMKATKKAPARRKVSPKNQKKAIGPAPNQPGSLAHLYGEMVSLLGQSALHKKLRIEDLEWLLMPALILGQVRIFRAGALPIGMALWAWLDEEGASRLNDTGRIGAADWRKGTDVMEILMAQKAGKSVKPNTPEGDLWLVDFVCPYATNENNLLKICMADLMDGPLKGQVLKMLKTNYETGEKSVVEVGV